MHRLALATAVFAIAPLAQATECDTPDSNRLFCEDFEDGGLGWDAWYAASPFIECNGCSTGSTENPDRILLDGNIANAHTGSWSLHMPAAAAANYTGASLTYRSCAGTPTSGCTPLVGYDQLHFRAWVNLASDHQYVHHFMAIGGTQANGYWEGDGNAGCRPNGYRAAGSTLDFNGSHELFFYTYTPDMGCDNTIVGGGYCDAMQPRICDDCAAKEMPCLNGPECCWGNLYSATPRPVLPVGQWVCLEIMMRLNTPGRRDGDMAFWIDGTLAHHQTCMVWRDVAELQLNKIWVQHYIANGDASQSNSIRWDDIIASTAPIGCGGASPDPNDTPYTDCGPVNPVQDGAPPQDGPPPQDGASTGDGPTITPDGGVGDSGVPPLIGGCGACSAASFDGWLALLALLAWRTSTRARRTRLRTNGISSKARSS